MRGSPSCLLKGVLMLVYSLMTNTFGEPRLFGVYEDAKAASLAFEHLTNHADPGDEYRIRFDEVESYAEVKERTDRCNACHAIDNALTEETV